MDTKTCSIGNIEKHKHFFLKKIQNVKIVTAQADWNVTLETKIKIQSNKRYIMIKKRKNIHTETKQ